MITLRAKHICGILLIVLLVNDTACLALDVLHLIGSYSEVPLLVDKWPSGGFVLKKKSRDPPNTALRLSSAPVHMANIHRLSANIKE